MDHMTAANELQLRHGEKARGIASTEDDKLGDDGGVTQMGEGNAGVVFTLVRGLEAVSLGHVDLRGSRDALVRVGAATGNGFSNSFGSDTHGRGGNEIENKKVF